MYQLRGGRLMKQCPYCHNQLNKQQCLDCGVQVHFSADPPSKESSQADNKKSIKKWIPLMIIGFLSVLLVILFLLLRNFNSPEAQAKILVNAVNNHDTAKVSNLISTKQNKVGRQEAERYITFIKEEMGMTSFEKKVFHQVAQFDDNSPVSYVVKTDKDQDVLRISKNGRRYLIFDNLSFQAPMKKAVLQTDATASYEFQANESKKKVMGKQGESIDIGQYIPGNYVLDTTKTTSRGTYQGKLKFNTASSDHDTVKVEEDFEEARIKVNLKNDAALEQASRKVQINGETLDLREDGTYGPFPLNKALTITAEGKSKGKSFKATTATIAEGDVKQSNEVTVEFDAQEIEKHNKAKEKDVKDKITDFIKKYTSARNKAGENNSIVTIKPYLLENTTFYQSLQSSVPKQQQQQNPKVTDVNRSQDFYSVTVESETGEGDAVQAHYLLQGDDNGKNLKIVNYEAY